jgi:hypothetical protein
MNTKNMNRPARATVAVAAAILTGSLAAAGASDPAARARESIERRELQEVVVRMPSGWPATDVMREAADSPVGEPSERARWLRMATSMPSGWPATVALAEAAT